VEKDIDEESKLLLTTLTPDETKALVTAQIQFIEYNLPNMGASTTVLNGIIRNTESSESRGIKPSNTEQFSSAPVSESPQLENDDDCLYSTSLQKCDSKVGKCSNGNKMNNDGQCLPPTEKCENGAISDSDDKGGKCPSDKTPCKEGDIANDKENCVKKSFCDKNPNLHKCKDNNDNNNGNDKDSDDNNSNGRESSGDKTVIQSANAIASANATVVVNTVKGTDICSLEGITAATY
jgi:hypothetical protein